MNKLNFKLNNKFHLPQDTPGSQMLVKSSACCTIAELWTYVLSCSKLPDCPHDFEHSVVFTQSFQRSIDSKKLCDIKCMQSLRYQMDIFMLPFYMTHFTMPIS